MYPILTYGSDSQVRQYLPGIARGELIGCFALTEHDGGSDPASMRTTARRDGSDYVIDGAKMWISYGNIADFASYGPGARQESWGSSSRRVLRASRRTR